MWQEAKVILKEKFIAWMLILGKKMYWVNHQLKNLKKSSSVNPEIPAEKLRLKKKNRKYQ